VLPLFSTYPHPTLKTMVTKINRIKGNSRLIFFHSFFAEFLDEYKRFLKHLFYDTTKIHCYYFCDKVVEINKSKGELDRGKLQINIVKKGNGKKRMRKGTRALPALLCYITKAIFPLFLCCSEKRRLAGKRRQDCFKACLGRVWC